jgi:hypothetical protein
MGYTGFSLKNFSSRFIPGVRNAETRTTILEGEGAGLFIGASLAQFLIFCKTFLAFIVMAGLVPAIHAAPPR